MRLRFLLFFLVVGMGFLKAQDTIRTLIISEARFDNQHAAYLQLTNVGSTTLDLSQFELGRVGAWSKAFIPDDKNSWFMLPKKNLAPGKSFVLAKVNDWVTKMWAKDPLKYTNRYESKPEFFTLADMKIHVAEAPKQPDPLDSVSPMNNFVAVWNGRDCWYLRHHVAPGDSVVVDQVGGTFDESDATNYDKNYDVAGMTNATGNAVLVRKNTIKKGNSKFVAGTNADESEWMVVPFLLGGWEPNRAIFWTVGNHGNYHLKSLASSTMTFNTDTTTLTVPWGVRNDDSIMYKFTRVPGIAWHYDYAGSHADSAYVSVRSGDKLTLYACGDKLEKKIVTIVASAPKTTDNLVIPMKVPNNKGFYTNNFAFCDVTDKAPVIDTIRAIQYACRKDSLLKYLEKPEKATWKFIFVDGVADRADLKKGDILEVTAENGTSKKQYYIKPNPYYPSHDAYLSAITWPDIPDSYKNILGWSHDTIPTFFSSKLNYKLTVPFDVTGIPALVGKKNNLNSKLQVNRALNLTGSVADRTVTFNTTAEDDTSKLSYKIELVKEQDKKNIQHWKGEPFISQYVFKQDYNNDFCEIVNPGTDILDLSNYMLFFGYCASSSEAIGVASTGSAGDFSYRYKKYIPGKRWVDQATWASKPATCVSDANINPLVQPGDVFVAAFINSSGSTSPAKSVISQIDINFNKNPWGEDLSNPWDATLRQWTGQKVMLFKILNDSVKNGTKPATNPNDFKLIDVMGSVSPADWKVGGLAVGQVTQYVRKPNVFKGNPVIDGSFGTTETNSEWVMMNESRYAAAGYGWPDTRIMVADGIGSHFMNTVTVFKSTVSSNTYKVTEGYSTKETIKGVLVGTTVSNFLTNIIKADTGQHLKLKKVLDGSILTGTGVLSNGDTLIVVSSDSVNTTKYTLITGPLSNNALLTSTTYTIAASGATGTVSKFDYGTDLKTVVAGVTVPANAAFNIIDAQGAYMPLKKLNFDTLYVNVKVSDQIKFEVIAEDGTTKIVYTLQPNVTDSTAYLTSDVYSVDQTASLINFVPGGTTVSGFVPNLIPATGATIKVLDKLGMERTFGNLFKDDMVLVTAKNGKTTKTYYLSMLGLKANYLAYVTSTTLSVDQIGLKIAGKGIKESLTVTAFIAKLTPASGATVKLYDKLGVEKLSTANIAKGDVIKVTSGDGLKVVPYSITMDPTSVTVVNNNKVEIQVYPNPSVGSVNVSGVEPGSTIGIYNLVGELILEKVALQGVETISLNNQPQGLYFVKVVTKGKQDVSLKLILK